MCGIAGYIGSKNLDLIKIENTLNLMKNRGPDHSDYFHIKIKNIYYYFLFSRLSIIDCNKRANQPFKYKNYIIIFNGEIYNYIELKKKFFKNERFETTSDTEVLIRLYARYKKNCLKYLEGMWSFAILNTKSGEVFFSRDRMGEKPFYYSRLNTQIYFGSETKFIQSLSNQKYSINLDKCKQFLLFGYNSVFKDDLTFFKNIKILLPANYCIYKEKFFKFFKYWDLKNIKERKINEKNAIKKIKKILINSVNIRLRSDVKTAYFLSGGVDSGALASIAKKKFNKKINSFFVSDTESKFYNEKLLHDKCAHDISAITTSLEVKNFKFFPSLVDNVKYFNSPVLTINSLVQERLFEIIKKKGFKVTIGGTGSDEIFAGYLDHHKFFLEDLKKINKRLYEKNLLMFEKYIIPSIRNKKILEKISNKNYYTRLNHLDSSFLKESKKKFTNHPKIKLPFKSFLKNTLYMQFHENLYPSLYQEDLNAMCNSVENRNPFLDRNLIEFLFSLSPKFFINNGFSKHILRASLKGLLTDSVRMSRNKYGFNVSFDNFKDINVKNFNNFVFKNKKYINQIINFRSIKSLLKKIDLKKITNTTELQKLLFRLLSTTEFLRQNQS